MVFLDLNERRAVLDDGQAFGLVMDVAEGRAEVDEIAERLTIEWAVRLRRSTVEYASGCRGVGQHGPGAE